VKNNRPFNPFMKCFRKVLKYAEKYYSTQNIVSGIKVLEVSKKMFAYSRNAA